MQVRIYHTEVTADSSNRALGVILMRCKLVRDDVLEVSISETNAGPRPAKD